MKKKEKNSILRSIRGKLILLGGVSIATTVILGFTGIRVLNSNNANNRVLEDINNINLLQNENRTLETTFLYDLDLSHYDTMNVNLDTMNTASADALKYGGSSFKEELSKIANDITFSVENTARLTSALAERSFQSTEGMYAEFLNSDQSLTEALDMMSEESDWIDGAWSDVALADMELVDIGGKMYRKLSYQSPIAANGKRDYLIVRIGGNGIFYTGNVYITNIKFDSTAMNVSALTANDLSKSYGEGMTGLNVTDFNGGRAITFTGAFSNVSENWQEASIEIPIAAYPMESSGKVSYEIYFEEKEPAVPSFATAFSEKYNFAGNLESANSKFVSYSKLVAEGTDTGTAADEIAAIIDTLKTNIPLYTTNTEAADKATTALTAKKDALQKIVEYDTSILNIKGENNELNATMTTTIADVRTQIEKNTENSRTSMFTLIIIVFAVGVVLVVMLTIFVIATVQKSINGFRSTLHSISEGQISVKAVTGRGDEFDVFGRSLNHMTDKLAEVLGSATSIAADVKTSGSSLENMASATSTTSSQIDISVSEIAKGANAQANDVEQSSLQITNLGNLMDEMVNHVTNLDETSDNMKQASDEAVEILAELSGSNEVMTKGIHNISEQISRTNDSVKKIEEAVSLISSIASQTNLLSLNASIEAARAGVAGKGFAVVATEIQQLAEQSNGSANTIYEVISALTKDFQTTLEIMKDVEDATNEQNEKLAATKKQFEIVNTGIIQSRDKTSIIKESIKECNQVRVTVSELMTSLSAISEENAAASSETADSMQVLNDTINELLAESQKLLAVSSKLESDMQFFLL